MNKTSGPHILKHIPSGKWLEHWIDGWYLTDKINDATHFYDADDSRTKLVPMLADLFGDDRIEIVFLEQSKPTLFPALQPTRLHRLATA